jgi:hypothetical protein
MKKVYGDYKIESCPFCSHQSSVKNSQGVPVCSRHGKLLLENLKCSCGKILEIKRGKFGPFFVCENCGIVKFSRGLEMNDYPLKNIMDL